jgi:hypothetical protein
MYIYTIQCMHYIYSCIQPCLIFLTSWTLVACNNYIIIKINSIINQYLLCNKFTTLNNTYNHATCIQFYRPIYIYDISSCLQLVCKYISIWNLKFKDLKVGQETIKQVTHGNISIDLPQCINKKPSCTYVYCQKIQDKLFFK